MNGGTVELVLGILLVVLAVLVAAWPLDDDDFKYR
jgi:hypothetical protein